MSHLNPLRYKIIGFVVFKADSPIHVGAGEPDMKRSFLRLPSGELLIPSSSWKGAFRSISEKLARTAGLDGLEGLAVELYEETQGGITYRREEKLFKKFVKDFLEKFRDKEGKWVKDDPEKLEEILKDLGYSQEEMNDVKDGRAEDSLVHEMAESYLALHCPIGKLYGNRVLAGKLRFGDVMLRNQGTHLKPGVGINRKTTTVKSGILYYTETIANVKMKLPIILDNPSPGGSDSKLLANTIDYVRKLGLGIGGRKSVGLGTLKISEDDSQFFMVKLDKEDKLALGNPFKKAQKLTISEFMSWLKEGRSEVNRS